MLRVLHLPGVGAGNPASLARAERMLGLSSWCVTIDPDPYGYSVDERVRGPSEGGLQFEWQRWRLLARAMRQYDVIHFNYGRTLFPIALQIDLPLLKAAGKRIFMTYQGDDARQGDYCRSHFEITFATRVPASYYTAESDSAKRRNIAWVGRFADGIYALNPDLLHVLPRRARFLPYANVDLDVWKPPCEQHNPTPVIVHAPTHRHVKGTDIVLAAVEKLKAEGAAFEFVLVEHMSHVEARRAYERADIAIDQLFAGWYGGFAVEMMALGKPVIGYLREDDLKFLPTEQRGEVPIVSVGPAGLVDALRELLQSPRSYLKDIGRRSRRYVEKWHDPLKIAARLKADYEAAG